MSRVVSTAIMCFLLMVAAEFCTAHENGSSSPDFNYDGSLLIPLANPLQDMDANMLAWHSAAELLGEGLDFTSEKIDLHSSRKRRFGHILLMGYFNKASAYYSHEIGHQIHNYRDNQHFRVDMGDWTHLVPEFVFNPFEDVWDLRNLDRYDWIVVMEESGLYQEKFNAHFTARNSDAIETTSPYNGMAFLELHSHDFLYNLYYGKDEVDWLSYKGYLCVNDNDITGYIIDMRDKGITISRDDWLIASALAFFASGHTWNSARSLYSYLMYGNESVDNLKFNISDRLAITPPNFYLFSTYRGLYLDTEIYLEGLLQDEDGIHLSLGTGLDSFGLNRTGPVDWVRVGGRYYPGGSAIDLIGLKCSPFCYFNFDRGFQHRGQAVGLEMRMPVWKRLFFRAVVEYSRNDMHEQVIKYREDGVFVLTALGIAL